MTTFLTKLKTLGIIASKILGVIIGILFILASIGLMSSSPVGSFVAGILGIILILVVFRRHFNKLFDRSNARYDQIRIQKEQLATLHCQATQINTNVAENFKQLAGLRLAIALSQLSIKRMDLSKNEKRWKELSTSISSSEATASRFKKLISAQESQAELLDQSEKQISTRLANLQHQLNQTETQLKTNTELFNSQVSRYEDIRRIVADHYLRSVDQMEGHDFEHYCGDLLTNAGFEKIRVTTGSGDQGLDVIGIINGRKIGIQCKNYAQPVGNKAVQEALAGKVYYDLDGALVLTNNQFTPEARNLARRAKIHLWGRGQLSELLFASACQHRTEQTDSLLKDLA